MNVDEAQIIGRLISAHWERPHMTSDTVKVWISRLVEFDFEQSQDVLDSIAESGTPYRPSPGEFVAAYRQHSRRVEIERETMERQNGPTEGSPAVVGSTIVGVLGPAVANSEADDRDFAGYWVRCIRADAAGTARPEVPEHLRERVERARSVAANELTSRELHPAAHYCTSSMIAVAMPDEQSSGGYWRPCDICNAAGFEKWRDGKLSTTHRQAEAQRLTLVVPNDYEGLY